ncbi:MAG: hypothetical protein ACFHWX_10540 [Bacteroidota bacterium]
MSFFRISKYLQYRWQAKNAHGIHSPFVFEFYNKVLKRIYRDHPLETELKRRYLTNSENIEFKDPKTQNIIKTKISYLAKRTWSGISFSYFLLKLCEWLEAQSFLETGTALGMTSSVVSHAKGTTRIHTIEGSKTLADLAKKLCFYPNNVQFNIIHGNIYEVFENVMRECKPEVVFLDADHRPEAIHFYLKVLNEQPDIKAIIIHDIYWSKEMNQVWNEIIQDQKYPLTIDLFHAGIIFPGRDMEKQHFTVAY